MNEKERSQGTVGGHDALDQGSHGDFAERADRQAGEGDANLHTGNDAVQVAEQKFHDFCLSVAASHQLPHARDSHRDKRKLHGGEKAVEHDKDQNAGEAQKKHPNESPQRHCSSTKGASFCP